MTSKNFEAACASFVLHELDIICRIARFNHLNKFNPYSVKYADDFLALFEIADNMRKDLDFKLTHKVDDDK